VGKFLENTGNYGVVLVGWLVGWLVNSKFKKENSSNIQY
jgi:hypothetical protein